MRTKTFLILAVLLLSFRLASDDLDPAVKGEVDAPLSDGQKSTLAIMLKAGKFSIVPPQDKTAQPLINDEDKKAGFILFKKQFQSRVFYSYKPSPGEIHPADFSVTVQPGEYAPLVVGLYPLEEGVVSVSIPDLMNGPGFILSSSNFEVRSVKHMLKQSEKGILVVSPEMMVKESPVKISKGVTRQIWISVRVPEGTGAGEYSGNVSFAIEGKAPVNVTFNVTVLPFKLRDDPNMSFGWFGTPSDELGLADYTAHGNNAATKGLDPVWKKGKKDKPELDFSKAEKNAAAFRKAGLLNREATIGVIRLAGDLTATFGMKEFSGEFKVAYREMLVSIRDWSKKQGIKPVIWLLDEPREKMLNTWNRNREDTIKYAQLAHEVEGIKTMVDPMRDTTDRLDYTILVNYLDVLCPHAAEGCSKIIEKTKEQKKDLWLYNSGRSRLGFGFVPWKHGAKARFEWAYAWGFTKTVSRDPESWSTSRGGDPNCGIVYPNDDEMSPTPYYEITKEGITDYKYAYTLGCMISEALASGSVEAKKTAEGSRTVLENIRSQVPPYSKGSDLKSSDDDVSKEDEWRAAITAEMIKLYMLK